jgi:hypothetical protein
MGFSYFWQRRLKFEFGPFWSDGSKIGTPCFARGPWENATFVQKKFHHKEMDNIIMGFKLGYFIGNLTEMSFLCFALYL